MLAEWRRRPWTLSRRAAELARLHHELHEIPAPPELGDGRLLHFDLHPDNVLLSPSGPVVIDWAIARAGDPALDVAMTWVLCATSGGLPGRIFARSFLRHFDQAQIAHALPAAAELRIADPNVTQTEREAVRRLAAK
jgi:aminoglycoside phosphotransferase (APT) family kinase protein